METSKPVLAITYDPVTSKFDIAMPDKGVMALGMLAILTEAVRVKHVQGLFTSPLLQAHQLPRV
jgi:hypothetical protein